MIEYPSRIVHIENISDAIWELVVNHNWTFPQVRKAIEAELETVANQVCDDEEARGEG